MRRDLIKDYFFSLKNYAIFAVLIFIFSIIFGYLLFYLAFNYFPEEESNKFIKEMEEQIESFAAPFLALKNFSQPWQVLLIWLKNIQSLGITIIFSFLYGFSAFLGLFVNGILLGFLGFIFLIISNIPFSNFALLILPHGIIEIPVMILGAAIGIRVGKMALDKTIGYFKSFLGKSSILKFNEINIKKELNLGCEFFLQTLLPLLFLAAILEVYVTGQLSFSETILL